MKYLSKILGILGFACCMSACYDNAFDVVGPNQPLKGDMTVNLTFKLQGEPAQTRSKVSGDETAGVFSMQLVSTWVFVRLKSQSHIHSQVRLKALCLRVPVASTLLLIVI